MKLISTLLFIFAPSLLHAQFEMLEDAPIISGTYASGGFLINSQIHTNKILNESYGLRCEKTLRSKTNKNTILSISLKKVLFNESDFIGITKKRNDLKKS